MREATLGIPAVTNAWPVIVRMPGTSSLAIYHKPNGAPELMVRGSPVGPIDFRVRAWIVANDTTRELGWFK